MLNDLRDTFGFKIPELFPTGKLRAYNRIIENMPTKPNAARKALIKDLVYGLWDDGEWQTKDILHITAAHASDSSLLNWINPGTHDLTVVNLIAGLFTIDRGWTGNGVNGYLDTNYNPSTDAINYALNNASFGCYIRTDVDEPDYDMGARSGGNYAYFRSKSGGATIARINSVGGVAGGAVPNSKGMWIANRVLSTHQDVWRNKVRVQNVATVSNTVPDANFYILSYNFGGGPITFATRQHAVDFAGGGMTQTNINNFTDRIETYMDAIGAGVIP